jgi:Domain of unknown function (DUF1707)
VRLSDGDRELLVEKLGCHAAAGRVDIAELERRVAAILAAQTREEAVEVMADLPPLGPEAPPTRHPQRGHGHGDANAPGVDWRPTAERFRDPRSGRVMRVWEDPAGGRHYVAEDQD